jgi:hypothetical protein
MASAASPEVAASAAAPAVVDFFPFAALPPALALKIFAALPADTRLRCAEVCTAWCAAVAERSLWTRLDLSRDSGVTHEVTPALLRAAAAKAGGALTALDVSGVWHLLTENDVLRAVLAANAATLRELRCLGGREPGWMRVPDLEALLSAAPQLSVCKADVWCIDAAEARRALRNEGVFVPLRMRIASVHLFRADEATVVPLFADVAAHASLAELHVGGASFYVPAMLDAFIDAALSLPLLHTVEIMLSFLSPASALALARLLGSGTLTELIIQNNGRTLLDAPAAALLGDALRANATLTSLTLHATQLWSDHAAAGALLGALTGHASLRHLGITGELDLSEEDQRHTGALLGALVAADAPALTALDVHYCGLSDAGVHPLFEALPGNTHLRELKCSVNRFTEAFATDVLLPAVRANTSLRTLTATHPVFQRQLDAELEAEALVAGRSEAAESWRRECI